MSFLQLVEPLTIRRSEPSLLNVLSRFRMFSGTRLLGNKLKLYLRCFWEMGPILFLVFTFDLDCSVFLIVLLMS